MYPDSSYFDVQQVCLAGHQITTSYHEYPQHRSKRCRECGAETIHECPNCGTDIRGRYVVPGVFAMGEKVAVPTFCDECGQPFPWAERKKADPAPEPPWSQMHPAVVGEAKTRFDAGHYADAVEAAMKVVNSTVKRAWVAAGRPEKDGKPLMHDAFSVNGPVIRVGDLATKLGRDEQEGYMHLFAGAMQAVRNPKAHELMYITPKRAIHLLFLASLLMHKLDEASKG